MIGVTTELLAHEKQLDLKGCSMKKEFDDYELRDEYDLSQLPIVPKGRYAPSRRSKSNIVVLEPDLIGAFPNDEAINNALRLVLQISRIPSTQKVAVGV